MKKMLILMFIYMSINASTVYKSQLNEKIFLNIKPSFYTINLSTLYYFDAYKEFIKVLKTNDNVFVFEFGSKKNTVLTKVLFGAYKSYDEAQKAVNNLPQRLKNNKPYIGQVGKFQELYRSYHIQKKPTTKSVSTLKQNIIALNNHETKIQSVIFSNELNKVIQTYPLILEQNALLNTVNSEKDGAFANFLPTVDYSYESGKINNAYDSTGATLRTDMSLQDLTITWNLFNGMQDYRYYKVMNSKYQSTLLSRQSIVDETIFEFVKAYLNFLKSKDIYALGDNSLESYEKYMEKKNLKEKYGMTSMSKGAAINKKYITAKINHLETNKKQFFDALYELQKYIDINQNTQITNDINSVNIKEFNYKNIIELALSKNPQLLQAKVEIGLSKLNLDKEYKNYMPSVNLIAQVKETDDTYTDREEVLEETTIKLQAKINLFNGGKDQYLIKQKRNEYKQKQQKYNSVQRDVKYNVKTALNEYKNLEEKNLFVNELLDNANKAYTATQYDFAYAKTDEDGLLSSMESLQAIKKQSIELKYDMLIAKYKLLYKVGIIQSRVSDR